MAEAALGAPPAFDRLAVGFARVLRSSGLDVPVGSTLLFGEALGAVGVDTRAAVYWAGVTTLVRRPEDLETYDKAFAAWWERTGELSVVAREEREISLAFDVDDDDPDDDQGDDGEQQGPPSVQVRYSRNEVLRARDFAEYTPDEFAEARRLMADLRFAGALRESRRLPREPTRPGPTRPAPHRAARDPVRW